MRITLYFSKHYTGIKWYLSICQNSSSFYLTNGHLWSLKTCRVLFALYIFTLAPCGLVTSPVVTSKTTGPFFLVEAGSTHSKILHRQYYTLISGYYRTSTTPLPSSELDHHRTYLQTAIGNFKWKLVYIILLALNILYFLNNFLEKKGIFLQI